MAVFVWTIKEKMVSQENRVPFVSFDPGRRPLQASEAFLERMQGRRSVRSFCDRPVSEQTIKNLVAAAGSGPSGANKQPWRFVCVRNPDKKRAIRAACERVEKEFFEQRVSAAWAKDLDPLGVDFRKPFLEQAPWLIAVFRLVRDDDGGQVYHSTVSVGIAVGILFCAIQHAGLAALPYTPMPMQFLGELLGRPSHERPFMLIPVGYPAKDCSVPDIARKPLSDILVLADK